MNLQDQLNICADSLANYLIANQLTISFAESVTGGKIMSALIATPNISKVLLGGVVCYSENFKRYGLKISNRILDKYSAESWQTSKAIAEAINKQTKSRISVGITGLASFGASASPHKPAGTVYTCIMIDGSCHHDKFVHSGTREDVRLKASIRCVSILLNILKNQTQTFNSNFLNISKL